MQEADPTDLDQRVSRTLFCKGLTQQVTQSILYELFLIAGPIQCIHLPRARPWETKEAEQKPDKGGGETGKVESRDTGSSPGKKPARPQSDRIGESAEIRVVDCVLPGGKRDADDLLVVTSKAQSQHRTDVHNNGALSVGVESGSKDALAVESNAVEKPYSVDDKILYRYRVVEHQGYAFIMYCYVQSVDYAIKIFQGTKLFGSQISMSPAKQAMCKTKEFYKFPENDSNAVKSKSEIRQRQASVASHRSAPSVGRNRDVSNCNINFQRDQIASERYNNSAPWNGARIGQNIPPGKNYLGTNVYGSGNWQNNLYAANAPRTVQGNWRVRLDGNNRGFVAGSEATRDSRDQWQYCRGRYAPRDELATNSFGNAVPRSQTQSFRGSQRKTVLHASIPHLGRSRFERGNPIIESGSFLPLTPNLAQLGYNPPVMAPPHVATERECCSNTVDPPRALFELDQPQSKSPLTFSGDEQIPILFYEMDTKPDNQTFSGNIYVDGQAGTENWDSPTPTPMDDNAHLMSSLALNQDGSMPEQLWDGGGAGQFSHLVPDRLSLPQVHYQGYGNDEFSSCEPTTVTDSRITFNEMQYLDPNHLNNSYVQTQFQGYGTEHEQWQSEHPQSRHGHVLNGHQVNHFDQSSQQIINQLRLLNLGYDSCSRPAEPITYTRVFGQGVEHDPAMLACSDDLSPRCQRTPCYGINWQNDPYYVEQNTKEFLHRSQSVPCHVPQTKRGFTSRASGNMEEVTHGDWVSPVVWRGKGQSTWSNPNQYGAQKKPDRNLVGRVHRSSRNFSPVKNKSVPSPKAGSAKKPERRYTLSECLDTAFEVYHQGNAVNSPRSKPTGVSSRKSGAF